MQMTSRGEGGLCDGALSSLFFPFREHPLLSSIVPQCDSWSWQCEGENKNELAVQPGSVATSDATTSPPPPPKKSRANQTGPAGMKPEAEHTPIDSTILQHPPKTLKCVIVPSRISCKTKTVSAFGFPLFSWPQYAWHFSRRALCTLASANIRKLFRTQTLFSLLPARGHANAHGPRGKFF